MKTLLSRTSQNTVYTFSVAVVLLKLFIAAVFLLSQMFYSLIGFICLSCAANAFFHDIMPISSRVLFFGFCSLPNHQVILLSAWPVSSRVFSNLLPYLIEPVVSSINRGSLGPFLCHLSRTKGTLNCSMPLQCDRSSLFLFFGVVLIFWGLFLLQLHTVFSFFKKICLVFSISVQSSSWLMQLSSQAQTEVGWPHSE